MKKPFLTSIAFNIPKEEEKIFPFTVPAFEEADRLEITSNVSFFVGENGAGKSTLLEAIAEKCGFNTMGGNRNHVYNVEAEPSPLAGAIKLGWSNKTSYGFFMRAESYYQFASYVDEMAKEFPKSLAAYGGKSLHQQSHGESFLSLFTNKFDNGIFLLDEPEAALSPARQLSFLSIIKELNELGTAQFIIATHSPILLSYPGAQLFDFDNKMNLIEYTDTDHFNLTKNFLNNPEAYLQHL